MHRQNFSEKLSVVHVILTAPGLLHVQCKCRLKWRSLTCGKLETITLLGDIVSSSSVGLSPGQGQSVLPKNTTQYSTHKMPFSTQVHKMVPPYLHALLRVILRWTSIPSRGSRSTPCCFVLYRKQDKLRPSQATRLYLHIVHGPNVGFFVLIHDDYLRICMTFVLSLGKS